MNRTELNKLLKEEPRRSKVWETEMDIDAPFLSRDRYYNSFKELIKKTKKKPKEGKDTIIKKFLNSNPELRKRYSGLYHICMEAFARTSNVHEALAYVSRAGYQYFTDVSFSREYQIACIAVGKERRTPNEVICERKAQNPSPYEIIARNKPRNTHGLGANAEEGRYSSANAGGASSAAAE